MFGDGCRRVYSGEGGNVAERRIAGQGSGAGACEEALICFLERCHHAASHSAGFEVV